MATLYARPDEEIETTFEAAPTGLEGTAGYTVYNLSTGAVQVVRTTAGIKEIPAGSGYYYASFRAPSTLGAYSVIWDTGVLSPTTSGADTLLVTSSGRPPSNEPLLGNLVSLEQFKRFKGIPSSDTDRDEVLEDSIAFMSEAIRKYTDRSFGLPQVTGVRTFDYDQDGFLEIDDATTVTAVEFEIGGLVTPVQSYAWRAEPVKGPIFDYLTIPHWAGVYSPEMGFTYNLDVISKERGWPGVPPTVKVTATWGWPGVPADVQAACLIAVANYADNPDENVSESIENYSFSRGGSRQFGATESVAIPGRARDLLAPYVRFMI